MKKQKMVFKCTQEEMFNALLLDFKNQYRSIKNEDLKDEKIIKGFTFSKELPKKKKSNEINVATYRVLECQRPTRFMMEYVSKTYHKVISTEISAIDEQNTQILFGEFEEKMNGNKPSHDYGEDQIVRGKMMTKMAIKKMLKEKE